MYDPEEHVKDVYANFGLAIYYSQVLEQGLAIAIVTAKLLPERAGNPVPRSKWVNEFDSFINVQYRKTLGGLIKSLQDFASVTNELEVILNKALSKRNYLAHAYFRDRAEDFMHRKGRDNMIEELVNFQHIFDVADQRLSDVIKPLREKYGITDELLGEHERDYISRLQIDL